MKKLETLLTDLKRYGAISLKFEFEDEGTSFKDAKQLSILAQNSNISTTIKIGGCGALNDIKEAHNLNAKTIVAPMIESAYAMKKFVSTIENVYNSNTPELLINIETIDGVNKIDDIISSPELLKIAGIVIGRFDLAKSMGLGCKDIQSKPIENVITTLLQKISGTNKKIFIGGGIKKDAFEYFKKFHFINNIETRKIVFDAKAVSEQGIIKALEFELEYLKLSQFTNSTRIAQIEERLNLSKTM